ncbi:type II secretion system F family protein [Calycomorphotria hydatis]|uniref:Type II secretion system protein F n=1 Tax=Calycomorphotria hydatis TaxID=2528027 RepID=A0A517TB47_9PLAN|nr:type II secretion system F family protein [Calycomorphotria hydatis]QDT65598.1 Putative type II secretion system protein F [Calycomorphotria hydatis]
MQFHYQTRDVTGHVLNGDVFAGDERQAIAKLRGMGLTLISIEQAEASSFLNWKPFERRVSKSEIVYLTGQLAIMLDSGVPLATALNGLSEQSPNPKLCEIISDIASAVEGGDNFSTALARHPKQFDRTYVNLMRASEASGTMPLMLERLAEMTRAEMETRQKVVGALMYPAAMLFACIASSVFLLTYVFPKLKPMFASRSLDLPTPTLVVMTISDSLIDYWYLYSAGAALAIGLVIFGKRQQWGRRMLDACVVRLPVVGSMLRKVSISRSLRTLATTVNADVPMLDALKLSGRVSNNIWYEEAWTSVADEVMSGRQIHQALDGNSLFPATLLQMIAAGESTGKLGPVLNKVSDYYDREVHQSIKTTTSMIEPLMVLIMGALIGTIALAMLLPIFKLSGHVG